MWKSSGFEQVAVSGHYSRLGVSLSMKNRARFSRKSREQTCVRVKATQGVSRENPRDESRHEVPLQREIIVNTQRRRILAPFRGADNDESIGHASPEAAERLVEM